MNDKATTAEQVREQLAAELHRIADDIVNQQLPLYDLLSARLYLGVLDTRADLQRWADYLGTEIEEDGGTDGDIPNVEHVIRFDDRSWGPSFAVHAQISRTQDGAK